MCGIFGFFLRRPLTDDDIEMGRRATSMLAHRGPDGQGEWFNHDLGLFLGHRRLAVIDVSAASDQPMYSKNTVIVFNGEIYNFEELRAELTNYGEVFASSGDTEVLLAAWQRWGVNCIDRLDGMFAIALYDGCRLHLVTDPFAEKPLFVVNTAEGIFFASEAQVLISILGLSFNPSQEEIEQFLSLGFMSSSNTGYSGLEWILPGTLRSYSNKGLLEVNRRYWTAHYSPTKDGRTHFNEADIDQLADILIRLLRRRLRADVPMGLFLSSGVDSALIGALASRELGVALNSMTVSFSDGLDEAPIAALIASHLDLPHEIINSESGEGWMDLPQELSKLYGLPNDNVSGLFVQQMAQIARKKMIVALGGMGGDEAFYGYNKYNFLYRNRCVYKLPRTLFSKKNPVSALTRYVRRLRNMQRLLDGSPEERFLTLKNAAVGELLKSSVLRVPNLPSFNACDRDLLYAVRDFDIDQTLPASYAAAVDRGGMRASIEVRTPYLSRELFEFNARFSVSAMFANGSKTPLRELLRRYLPGGLVDFPKRGFVFPLKRYSEKLGETPPRLTGVDHRVLSAVWNHRCEKGYDEVALRLMILDCFMHRACVAGVR